MIVMKDKGSSVNSKILIVCQLDSNGRNIGHTDLMRLPDRGISVF